MCTWGAKFAAADPALVLATSWRELDLDDEEQVRDIARVTGGEFLHADAAGKIPLPAATEVAEAPMFTHNKPRVDSYSLLRKRMIRPRA